MSKEKCCGNCKHFKNEDADGYGWCELQQEEVTCAYTYPCHEPLNNGWTEITPDNVEEVYGVPEERIIIAFNLGGTTYYQRKKDMCPTLNTLAKSEGYYYYVLPELKKDGTE